MFRKIVYRKEPKKINTIFSRACKKIGLCWNHSKIDILINETVNK